MVLDKDIVYVKHIKEAIGKIFDYVANVNYEKFEKDSILQDAVIRQLQIIGEAARRISPESTQKFNSVPWKEVVGMRHKLVHDYFGVDLEQVWQAVTIDLINFKNEIEKI
jgi:uncharacterized protein with HEPN domain